MHKFVCELVHDTHEHSNRSHTALICVPIARLAARGGHPKSKAVARHRTGQLLWLSGWCNAVARFIRLAFGGHRTAHSGRLTAFERRRRRRRQQSSPHADWQTKRKRFEENFNAVERFVFLRALAQVELAKYFAHIYAYIQTRR